MHRFYCPNLHDQALSKPLSDSTSPPRPASSAPPPVARLDRNEAHHARRVLRLEVGQKVELFDGRGGVARGIVESWSDGAVVRVTEVTQVPAPRPSLDMAVAIPKGPRADEMVSQLSQLGVARLIPLRTSRSVVDPRSQKIDKFTRAAVESAKQCGRAHLMAVAPPADLAQVLREPYGVRLLAAPGTAAPPGLGARLRAAERVLILVGPEGGWSGEEHDAALAAGCEPWSLGPHVLRIETAAAAAAGIAGYLAAEHDR